MDSFSIGSHHALPSLAISAVDIAMSGAEVPSVMRNASLSLYIYIKKGENIKECKYFSNVYSLSYLWNKSQSEADYSIVKTIFNWLGKQHKTQAQFKTKKGC